MYLRHLAGFDAQFCSRRAANEGGLLVNLPMENGNRIFFTNTPQADLTDLDAVDYSSIASIVVQGSNGILYALDTSGLTPGLFLQINASNEVVFGDPPTATIPDPLAIDNLTVAIAAQIADLTVTGDLDLTGVASGTIVNFLGLDASNRVVSTTTAGISAAMFYESPTSPSGTYPNSAVAANAFFTIGNQLFDSGASLITITDATTLTVAVAGRYLIWWCGQQQRPAGADRAGVWLVINGIVVNHGTGAPSAAGLSNLNTSQITMSGMEARSLAAGDTIRLQNNTTSGSGAWLVRLVAVRISA